MGVKLPQVSTAVLCSFPNCPGSSHMLGRGSVLLSLFTEAVKASFGGAKCPIAGGILREKSLLPAPCSRRWEMLS